MSPLTPNELFSSAKAVLLIDWPSLDVPNALVACGLQVHVKNGPGETDFALLTLIDGKMDRRTTGCAPDRVDFVYVHRPISEMPKILDLVRRTSAKAIWFQSGRNASGARDERGCWLSQSDRDQLEELVAAAGLSCITEAYIGDVARTAARTR